MLIRMCFPTQLKCVLCVQFLMCVCNALCLYQIQMETCCGCYCAVVVDPNPRRSLHNEITLSPNLWYSALLDAVTVLWICPNQVFRNEKLSLFYFIFSKTRKKVFKQKFTSVTKKQCCFTLLIILHPSKHTKQQLYFVITRWHNWGWNCIARLPGKFKMALT